MTCYVESLGSICRALFGNTRHFPCAAALLGLTWLMWDKAGQMAGFGDVTAQLKLPLPPFVRLMSVLCAVTAAMHLWLVFAPPGEQHHPGTETGGVT